ncbi:MAG: PilN domain-containing protein [Gammaproteobacteria bacterium]|nr:PilN domain-containing protein [Gammaproteobacteria bacterium]MCW8910254.1 PilN domain-containing protein [Gammaproteobacteria bacterium]MCW9004032.1 PilN domain-containing protein [Gammaproteobacteria bacterium]MCW9055887.1 PilN domain-containing protein [Gammaproteobacteria bacterium]
MATHINLLPWRDELRKEQTRQFVSLTVISVIFTLAVLLLVHVNLERLISYQDTRNQILKDEIKKLDKELEKIKDLEETKDKLLSRMEIIQSLQQKRPQIVHLFDEIVRTVPEGLHLNSIKQQGDALTIVGIAESNGRVSAYMRNIDASDWMTKPRLTVIESKRKDGRGSEFTLTASQSSPEDKEEEQ